MGFYLLCPAFSYNCIDNSNSGDCTCSGTFGTCTCTGGTVGSPTTLDRHGLPCISISGNVDTVNFIIT